MENTVVPMLIGITGHRDLVDPDIIYKKCKDLFLSLKQTYENTPLCILSALAEGADQVCAEAALDSGADVWTILPFDEEAYLKTFDSDSGREKYLSLKSRSSRVIEIGEDPHSPEKYVKAGNFIVDHCTVLLAIWNGFPSNRPGGTYQVMDFAMNRYKYVSDVLPANRIIVPVIHMYSERKSQSESAPLYEKIQTGEISYGDSFDRMQKFDPEGVNSEFFRELFLPLNEFNQESCPQKKNMGIPEEVEKECGLSPWLERYSKSSKLAQYFQSRYKKQMSILFLGGIIGGLSVQIYGGVDLTAYKWANHLLLVYLLLWACSFYYWFRSHEKFHIKYLEQRLMTQILKNYIYMRLAGCEEKFWDKRADQCSCNNRLPVNAIKYWSVLAKDEVVMEQDFMSLLHEKWIKDQIHYLSGKVEYGKKLCKEKKIWQYSLTSTAIIFPAYFVIDYYTHFSGAVCEFLRTINGFIIAISLYALAMFMVYYDQKNIEKTQKEFQDMLDNFIYIQTCFSSEEKCYLKEKIIALGDASIEETLSWLNNYMDSRPEVIKS